jgi:shikimate kinase
MRIYLIGFMNSGKSSLGRHVAMQRKVIFLDTDALVEDHEHMTVQEIFTMNGESFFRDIESKVLRETAQYPEALIATGGGLPCHADNMDWINRHGISVYLEWPWEKLVPLLKAGMKGRPLLSRVTEPEGLHELEKLFFRRKPFYEKAAITIEMSDEPQENILKLEKTCNYIW